RREKLLEAARLALRTRLATVEITFQRGEVADRRIQPHVKVLPRRVRNRNPEVGRIARDVPVTERLVTLARQPLLRLVGHLLLQSARRLEPRLQELDAARV